MNKSMTVPAAVAAILSAAIAAGLLTGGALGQQPVFGGPEDTAYAAELWTELEKAKLVGADMIGAKPYEGLEPHGFVLQTLDTKITVGGHTGAVVVKRNFGPEGVSVDEVSNDPFKHLAAYTVMFKREAGYDADNKDWFWAYYLPDGALNKNPAGMELAGRVAKGADKGCIACHSLADGDDYLYFTDRIK